MPSLRRLRGVVLRLVRRRAFSIGLGLALAVPAVWLELFSRNLTWWLDGFCLVGAATGLALVWNGVAGLRPDWTDD